MRQLFRLPASRLEDVLGELGHLPAGLGELLPAVHDPVDEISDLLRSPLIGCPPEWLERLGNNCRLACLLSGVFSEGCLGALLWRELFLVGPLGEHLVDAVHRRRHHLAHVLGLEFGRASGGARRGSRAPGVSRGFGECLLRQVLRGAPSSVLSSSSEGSAASISSLSVRGRPTSLGATFSVSPFSGSSSSSGGSASSPARSSSARRGGNISFCGEASVPRKAGCRVPSRRLRLRSTREVY